MKGRAAASPGTFPCGPGVPILGQTGAGLGIADRIEDAGGALWRRVERAGEALFEPTLRLGVTGLSRAGKTVFITALVANLIERGRMPALSAETAGRLRAAFLQPHPDMGVPRFDYEAHLADLTGAAPRWPASTRAISELRLSLRIAGGGLRGALVGPRVLHLDIVDYPGEWLLDLTLIGRDYRRWSAEALARAEARPEAADWRAALAAADPAAPFDEAQARQLAAAWAGYLGAARAAGMSYLTPGRFLLPGDLEGAPALTFAPLPAPNGAAPRGSLWHEMARRYDGYRRAVVAPFFRTHFSRIDRQVVLVDVLGALAAGPAALDDLRQALAAVAAVFRPGRAGWLTRWLGGARIDRVLFAATKADHLHHGQHAALAGLLSGLLAEARGRAAFAGAATEVMALAALRTTAEETRRHDGETVAMVRGAVADGRQAAFHPGVLPDDPAAFLAAAREGAAGWPDGADFAAPAFLPAPGSHRPGAGLPHIRLDRAAEFLLGDRLR